jgi:hypothetical protein
MGRQGVGWQQWGGEARGGGRIEGEWMGTTLVHGETMR